MLDVTRNALRHLAERRRVTVVVNPDDLELVSDAARALRTELGGIEHLAVQSDRRIGPRRRDGAYGRREIDAAIETQLARARAIVDRCAGGAAEADDDVAEGRLRAGALARVADALRGSDLSRRRGRVSDLIGLIIEATGIQVEIGEVCMVGEGREPAGRWPCEVVGFRSGRTLLMPLGELHGIGPGTRRRPTGAPFRVAVGELLGRVIDGLGMPLDGFGVPATGEGATPPPRRRTR